MLKNVQEAKFESVLIPIAKHTLAKSQLADVKFEPFFTHILAHELMHGLGPHEIKVAGRSTTPREEIKDLYRAIEEAKADATGLFALQYMMDHAKEMSLSGELATGDEAERQLYTTFLGLRISQSEVRLKRCARKRDGSAFNYLIDQEHLCSREMEPSSST